MDLYGNIRTLAAKKGLSIRALEEKVDFPNGTIRRWNKSVPSLDKVIKIAHALNTTVDQLTGESKQQGISRIDGTLAAHAADRNHKLTPDEVDRIMGYLDGIIDADQAKNNKDQG